MKEGGGVCRHTFRSGEEELGIGWHACCERTEKEHLIDEMGWITWLAVQFISQRGSTCTCRSIYRCCAFIINQKPYNFCTTMSLLFCNYISLMIALCG